MPVSLAMDAIKKEPRPADMSEDVCEGVLEGVREASAEADDTLVSINASLTNAEVLGTEVDAQEAGAAVHTSNTEASSYHPDLGRVASGAEGTVELTPEEADTAAEVKAAAFAAAAQHAGRSSMLASVTRSASFSSKDATEFSRAMSTDAKGACMYHPDLGYVGDGPPETEEEAKAFALRAGLPPTAPCCLVSAPQLKRTLNTHSIILSYTLYLQIARTSLTRKTEEHRQHQHLLPQTPLQVQMGAGRRR